MKIIIKTYATIVLLLVSFFAFSQIKEIGIPVIKNYLASEYKAATQNWAIIQDNRGVIYVANNSTVLIYDGIDWQYVQLSNKGEARALLKDRDGKIWVGGVNDFGFLYSDSTSSINFKSVVERIPEDYRNFNYVWNIFEYHDFLILETSNNIFFISDNQVKVFHSENGYHTSFLVNNQYFVREWNKGLLKYQNDTLIQIQGGEIFNSERIYSILPFKGDEILIASRTFGLTKYDGQNFKPWGSNQLNNLITSSDIYCGARIKENYFAYGTLNEGIIIIDESGNLIQHLTQEKGLTDDVVYCLYLDNFDNLWAGTGNGISFIEISSPFTIFNEYHGVSSKSMFIDYFKETLYFGGEQNVFSYDWKNRDNFNDKDVFEMVENSKNQSWSTLNYDGRLFLAHNPGIVEIKDNTAINHLNHEEENFWKIQKIPTKENLFIVGTTNGFALLEYQKDFKYITEIAGFGFMSRFFDFDENNNLWVAVLTQGIYKLTLNEKCDSFVTLDYYGKNKGLPSNLNNNLYKIKNELVFSTEEDIYFYEENLDSMLKYQKNALNKNTNGIDGFLGIDLQDNIWFFDDIGYGIINLNDDSMKVNRVIPNKLSKAGILSFFPLDSTNVFFGYNNGIYHYDKNIIKNYDNKYNIIIQKIEYLHNDSLIFGGVFQNSDSIICNFQSQNNIPKIDFSLNSLRFKVAAIFFEENSENKFQFKLEGFDDNWTNWTNENTKEYTNLPPGKYTFHAKAQNVYLIESEEVTFSFMIKPPWYRTKLAIISFLILIILIFYLLNNLNIKRLEVKNKKLEEKIEERTYEIQLQKTKLEKQKAEIITQAEELEKINKELTKLSVVASETGNAILIMDAKGNFEWVNPAFTKIFGYTLQELVADISKNIIGEKTSPQIQYLIQVCMSEKKTVKYEFKTRDKQGKTIWVHTTLTPVLDDNGEIKNLVAIDSDITKLKYAENKIQNQNKNITGSIRYALTIQQAILPSNEDLSKYFDIFIIYRPKDIVSGDFYWFSTVVFNPNAAKVLRNPEIYSDKIKEQIGKYFFFAVVDCTGHGVPGAFMSLIGSRLLNEIINERKIYSPKRILEQLDLGVKRVLKQTETDNNDGMDLSICRFEKNIFENEISTRVIYSGAKLPIFYYSKQIGEIQKTEADRYTIGGRSNREIDFTNTDFTLKEGDIVFMFSDGLKDQSNEKRKKFGTSKTIKLLNENTEQPLEIIKQKIEETIDNWQGSEDQRDDITFLGIKI